MVISHMPDKGPIILLALSSFVSFSSTTHGLVSAALLFPFIVLMLACLSFTIWWIGRSSLRRNPCLKPSTR